ncbi:translation initiation factor eIF4e [Hesseltinella vesiculosa]|uniref:Translation initiation factor eIF4e n=1 Tax=Hesseltinella vesiculosa TaxID=101127 RepID=A0A1X2GPY3_9FUNG|nr:translation initiation factor eIF4e [Hesseltinella vesiculosa]
MEDRSMDLETGPIPYTFPPAPGHANGHSSKPTNGIHQLSPAASAFQSFWPAPSKPSLQATPNTSPQQTRSARATKDGFIYKEKLIVLDPVVKEKLVHHDSLPLHDAWTFWYDRYVPNLPASEYEANLQQIATVDTVQTFWAVYNNIDGPEELGYRFNLHFMRKGIKPIWEDVKNAHGGSYNFKVNKQQSPMVWRDLLVLLIGENVETWMQDELCGLTVSSRQHCDNYQLWIGSTQDKNEPDGKIKAMLTQLLQPVDIQAFYFKIHKNHAAFQNNPPFYPNKSRPNNRRHPSNQYPAPTQPPLLKQPFQIKQKITEENIEQVVADIERLAAKKPIRKIASKPSIQVNQHSFSRE